MANEFDTGNPNFFRTFKGKYALTLATGVGATTDVVMLSCVNDVQVLGDFTLGTYTAGTVFATLDPECRPGTVVKIPVVVHDTTDHVDTLTVGIDGGMFLGAPYTNATVHMSGINFNISDNWY